MGDRIRVLVVDDQPQFAELAKLQLEREDDRFDIDAVTSPAEAMALLRDGGYDCIVSDYDMPETDGIEFFDEVRSRGIDLPFIIFSGMEKADLKNEPRFSAVTGYLQKGGAEAFRDLARRIRVAVSEYRADRDPLDVEARYDALFEQTSLAIAWIENNGDGSVVVDCNEQFGAEFAGPEADPTGTKLADVLDAVDLDIETIEEHFAGTTPASFDGDRVTEGAVKRYRWQLIPLADPDAPERTHGLLTAADITNQATTQHELELYRTIVEAAGDPMYVLDISGRFAYVNDAMAELSGYAREELIGANGRIIMSEEGYKTGTDLIRSLLTTADNSGTFEMDLHTASGETIPCENRVTLIYDVETGDGDTVKGTAGVLRDISDRKRRMARLRRHNERLEELAAFISHDLRNPINTAAGYLELAADRAEIPEHEAIAQSLDRMEEMIDDLLVMARADQTVANPEPVQLGDVAKRAWRQLSTGEMRLNVRSNPTIMADESWSRQLLENLFSNAVEHGGSGGTVTVGGLDGGIYIEDDGPGIPAERREDVFRYGYTTSKDGSGFGLSIVKQIVDAHGWSIEVGEGRAGGARFEITNLEVLDAVNHL